MATVYTPPGISVQELYSPSVSTVLSDAAQVCVVGKARGYQTAVRQVVIAPNTATVTFAAPPNAILVSAGTGGFVSVANAVDPTQGAGDNSYSVTADYTTVTSSSTSWTVTLVSGGDLKTNGGTVNFTFRYLPETYYNAIRLDSQAAVEARFGPAFNTSGVANPLSHAVSLAFENGAATVVCQPLFTLTTPTDPASVRLDGTEATATHWRETLAGLRYFEDINIIVPAVGLDDSNQTSILLEVQNHLSYMVTQGQYLMMVAGEDSSTDITQAGPTKLRADAQVLADRNGGSTAQQTILVSPSRFRRGLPSGGSFLIGGQYAAAAIAGMIASRPIAATLTRKTLAGLVEVSDPRSVGGKNDDAAAGLLVIEQKGNNVQVRHAITLDTTSAARREISVVRAKHHMIESIRDTIDSQIIGQVPADGNAPMTVKNAVIGVLETLRGRGELVDYNGVAARNLVGDPTKVEVRFSYRPSFPLNYIDIIFSLDVTSGGTTTATGAV